MLRGIFLIAQAILLTMSFECGAQQFTVEKLGREIGLMSDVTYYSIRGASVAEVAQALKIVRIRDSAKGSFNKVAEHDFSPEKSIAMVRPLSVPTGIVIKYNEAYIGGGWFGPVWGYFELEVGDGFVLVKDNIAGSPIFRFGHHTFAQGVQALTRALNRVRNNPNRCEGVL